MVKNILYLDSKEAMDFFMKSEQYHGFELPEHLVFDELFQDVKETIADTSCVDCLQDKTLPDQLPDIYLYILLNKYGREAFHYRLGVSKLCNRQALPITTLASKHGLHAGQKIRHIPIHTSAMSIGNR